MREIVWALIRRRARVRAPPRRSARKRAVRSDRSEHTPPATSAAGAGNGPSSRDASAVNIEAAARRERRGTKTKTRQMAAANGESARGELTRVESSKVASAIRDYRSKLHRLAGVLPSSGGHRGGLFLARHILPRSCRVDVIPLRHSWCSGDAMADHFVTAELARLSSVADARDAAAAAAAESEQHPYLVEVARRARAAHDLAAALAASPPRHPRGALDSPRALLRALPRALPPRVLRPRPPCGHHRTRPAPHRGWRARRRARLAPPPRRHQEGGGDAR